MLDERTKLKLSLVSWPISFKFKKKKIKLNRKKLKLIKNRCLELGFFPKYINISKMTLEQKDLLCALWFMGGPVVSAEYHTLATWTENDI